MSSHDPELSQAVKDLAERAARLYVKRRAAAGVEPERRQSDALPTREANLLDEAGLDVSDAIRHGTAHPAIEAQTEYMAILTSSLTVQETSALLRLSPSRIRQMIRERSLAAIEENRRYRVPRFQFVGSQLVRAFGSVYRAAPPDVPLILFFRWFTQPSPDLPIPGDPEGRDLSPVEWLLGGFDSSPVRRLAAAL